MTRRLLIWVLTALVAAGFAAPAVALPDPDPADVTAVATLQKEASATTVAPGETFTYTLTIGCSSITDNGCRDAVLSDVVPAPFEIVDVVVGGGVNTADPPIIDGNNVTVNWTTPLGDGTVGILDATTGIVEIIARLPEDASHDFDGAPVLNDAVIEGTNIVDADDQVEVTPVVPLGLATAPTKSFVPTSAISSPGMPVTAALGATNGSNTTVDSLTIQDPTTPDTSPNPFDYLGFTGFGDVSAPEGATATVYEVYVDGAWVEAPGGALPGGVEPADVLGTRVTFSGAIPAGATASVDLDLETTELASQ
jgi:hypothetical protein